MLNLQELITRGRFVFSAAPGRLEVFKLVNGKKNTQEIARATERHVNSIRRDLTKLSEVDLIAQKRNADGEAIKKAGFPVYEKLPLARAIPIHYFKGPAALPITSSDVNVPANKTGKQATGRGVQVLTLPTEREILDIARHGEDQLYEFKSQGTDVTKITKEVAAMLNTRRGGMIFYGIDDDGTIQGTDVSRQKLDQPLQNSVRNRISPSATISLRATKILGTEILVVIVPPWNRKDVYQCDEKVRLRKGTNIFAASADELQKLHRGEYVV